MNFWPNIILFWNHMEPMDDGAKRQLCRLYTANHLFSGYTANNRSSPFSFIPAIWMPAFRTPCLWLYPIFRDISNTLRRSVCTWFLPCPTGWLPQLLFAMAKVALRFLLIPPRFLTSRRQGILCWAGASMCLTTVFRWTPGALKMWWLRCWIPLSRLIASVAPPAGQNCAETGCCNACQATCVARMAPLSSNTTVILLPATFVPGAIIRTIGATILCLITALQLQDWCEMLRRALASGSCAF